MKKSKNLYDVLQVTQDSTTDVINAAYSVLNKKYRSQAFDDEDKRTYLLWELDYAHAVLSDSGVRLVYDMQLTDAYIDELFSDIDSSTSSTMVSAQPIEAKTANIMPPQKNNGNKKFTLCFCLVCVGITVWIVSHLGNPYNNNVHSTTAHTTHSAMASSETEREKTYYRVGPPTTANTFDDGTDIGEYFSSSSNNYDDDYGMFLDDNEEIVWITPKGKRYHSNSSCSNMMSPEEVPLSEAEDMGYTPCQKCY